MKTEKNSWLKVYFYFFLGLTLMVVGSWRFFFHYRLMESSEITLCNSCLGFISLLSATVGLIITLTLGILIVGIPKFKKKSRKSYIDEEWERRVSDGRCGRCNKKFAEHSPHYAGGMCRFCWSSNA